MLIILILVNLKSNDKLCCYWLLFRFRFNKSTHYRARDYLILIVLKFSWSVIKIYYVIKGIIIKQARKSGLKYILESFVPY